VPENVGEVRGSDDRTRRGLTPGEHVWHTLAGLGFAIQAVTGIGGRYGLGEVSGWVLFVHMLGAPLFFGGLTATVVIWAHRCRFGSSERSPADRSAGPAGPAPDATSAADPGHGASAPHRVASSTVPRAAGIGRRPSPAQKLVFWLATVLGVAVAAPMLAAMLPVFGYAAQQRLIAVHRVAALALLGVMGVHSFVSLSARWKKG